MKRLGLFIKNINPLQKSKNNSVVEHTLQKLLAFVGIYCVSAIIMEIIIILLFSLFGYDLLHGKLPTEKWVACIPLLGMIGFLMLTLFYIKKVEKRSLFERGIAMNRMFIKTFFKGIILGSILVVTVLLFLVVTKQYTFQRVNMIPLSYLVLCFFAYLVQSSAEEVMCRGFLHYSLQERMQLWSAILISSAAFTIPHLSTVFQMDTATAIVASVNLLLVSTLFSLTYVYEKSIGIACGIHFAWNLCLGTILGLNVSGNNTTSGIFQLSLNSDHTWFTGGQYGIEASIILTPILILCTLLYSWHLKGEHKYDIQQKTI